MSRDDATGKVPSAVGDLRADVALDAAARQLDLAVREQEHAVTRILGLIEVLQAHATDRATRARLDGILEACAFQDLTGQRVTKVSRLLRHLGRSLGETAVTPPHGGESAPTGNGLTQEQVDRLLRGGTV
ncbi:MAG: hypothetical protein WCZ23_04985 [Rhodospirillaceae bacterium]